MYLNVDVWQFPATLQFLPEITSHPRSNIYRSVNKKS